MPDIKEFIDKKNTIALVGASNNKGKYGNKIFLDLKSSGYNIHPINLTEDLVEGKKCYKTLTELSKEHKIDLVITVVPPRITEQISDFVVTTSSSFWNISANGLFNRLYIRSDHETLVKHTAEA